MPTKPRMIFVNLAVRDLAQSMAFFKQLGFEFNAQFTDDKAACMVLSEHGYVMLLRDEFFRTFTEREPCDTTRHNEALLALSCESRAEVDELVERAVAAGGRQAQEPQDHGFMYESGFYDLDGHAWGPFWMDPAAMR